LSGENAPGHPGPELRAVLFDMDGLLVDSEPLWFEAECAVMATMGGSWTRADQLELTGGSLGHSVGYMRARALRPAEPELVGRWLLDTMAALIAERGVPLMTGAAELLAGVAAAGIPMALVTSAQRRIMDAVIARTGLAFGVTVCAEDVSRGKPDPEPYLRAAAALGQPPAGCVVLEDSPRGIAAAEAAGCPVIAVPSVPLPAALGTARPGRALVTSLREVDLARLRRVVAVSPRAAGDGRRDAAAAPAGAPAAVCDDEGDATTEGRRS
jgi:HAD superfamily hydrolase (TIGR01509 family)